MLQWGKPWETIDGSQNDVTDQPRANAVAPGIDKKLSTRDSLTDASEYSCSGMQAEFRPPTSEGSGAVATSSPDEARPGELLRKFRGDSQTSRVRKTILQIEIWIVRSCADVSSLSAITAAGFCCGC